MKKNFMSAALIVITVSTAFAQANTSLSNLSATSINQSLVPKSDNKKNLGSSSAGLKDLHLGGVIYIQDNFYVYSPSGGYDDIYYDNDYNTIVGWQAYSYDFDGPYPAVTAIGYQSLYYGDYYSYLGGYVTAVGKQAGYNALAGASVAIGALSLFNTFGDYYTGGGFGETANGASSLYGSILSNYCTAEGADALYNSNVDVNTACGWGAGYNVQTGDSDTFLGYNADCGTLGTLHNATAIGANASVITNNTVRVGNSSVTSIGGFTNWSNVSDARVKKNIKENVPGLAFIELLRPVTFNYNLDAADKIMFPEGKRQDTLHAEVSAPEKQIEDQARKEKEKIVYSGFLAQDVEAAAEKIGYDFSGVEKPQNENALYGLRYEEFVVPLVKAVQELDQQQTAISDSENVLQSQTDDLEKKVSAMENQLSGYEDAKISSSVENDRGSLGQNVPNPFDHSTSISFHLPKNWRDASIVISNPSTGEVITAIPISDYEDHIQIDAGTLTPGTYQYSLVANGKVIDTRQMVLTK